MPAKTRADISAEWLAKEPPLPGHCVKHGLPAVRTITFAVKSDPKIGSRRKVLVPGYTSINRAAEYLRQVKVVKVNGWPLCARCVRKRAIGMTAAGTLLIAGLAALLAAGIGGGTVGLPPGVIMVLCFGGLTATLLSVVPFQRVSLRRLCDVQVTDDAAAVLVTNPSLAFTAGLPREAWLTQNPD